LLYSIALNEHCLIIIARCMIHLYLSVHDMYEHKFVLGKIVWMNR